MPSLEPQMRSVALVALVTGCSPKVVDSWGATDMARFFDYEVDGAESWVYVNRDPAIGATYTARLDEQAPEDDVVSVDWAIICPTSAACVTHSLYTVQWRVDSARGVFLAGLLPAGAERLDDSLDVQLASQRMDPGDSVVTATGGFTFESTFVGFVGCPVVWSRSEDWGDDCIRLDLTDGDADPATNRGLVGSYYAIVGYDLVAWQGEEDADVWELSDYSCAGGC
jgi:hypothetical protein